MRNGDNGRLLPTPALGLGVPGNGAYQPDEIAISPDGRFMALSAPLEGVAIYDLPFRPAVWMRIATGVALMLAVELIVLVMASFARLIKGLGR